MASTIIVSDESPKQVIKLTRRRQPNGLVQPISLQKLKAMDAYYNSENTGTSPLLKRLTRKTPVHQRIGGMDANQNSKNTGTSPLLKRLSRKAPVHQRIGGMDMKQKQRQRLKYINYQNGLYTSSYRNRLMFGNKFIRVPAQNRLDMIKSGFLNKKIILRKQWPKGHLNNLMVRIDNTPQAAPIHSVHKLDEHLQLDIKLLQAQCTLPNVIPNTRLDGGAATSCTKLTMNARFSTYP